MHEEQHNIYIDYMVNSMLNSIGCECFLCKNNTIERNTFHETNICNPRACRKKLSNYFS